MAQEVVVQKGDNGSALSVYGKRSELRELDERLRLMLPGADKLSSGQRLALAQAAVAHGLDPLNGEIWMIPGRGLMIGIKGLRKKAHQQVKGNYWINFREISDPDEQKRLRIPASSLAYEALLFDSENIRTYTEAISQMTKAGIPWESVKDMVGNKPYTSGIGVLRPGENTKMEPSQCAMKRAEADAIKRRFDVPFGLEVVDDEEPVFTEWKLSEDDADDQDSPPFPSNEEADRAIEQRERDKKALFGEGD